MKAGELQTMELFVLVYGMSRDREGAQNVKMPTSE